MSALAAGEAAQTERHAGKDQASMQKAKGTCERQRQKAKATVKATAKTKAKAKYKGKGEREKPKARCKSQKVHAKAKGKGNGKCKGNRQPPKQQSDAMVKAKLRQMLRQKQKRRSSQTDSRADHVLVCIQWLLQWKGFRRLDRVVKGGGGASTVWQHAVCRLGVVDWDLLTRICRLGVF